MEDQGCLLIGLNRSGWSPIIRVMELTASQLNKLPAYRDFLGNSNFHGRADRPALKNAIRRLYRA